MVYTAFVEAEFEEDNVSDAFWRKFI